MKCSAGVAAAAVVVLLGSALSFLAGWGMLYLYLVFMKTHAPGAEAVPPGYTPDTLRYFGAAMSVVVLAFASLGMATGVGLFRLWRWARYSVITWGGFLVLISAMTLLFVLLIPLPVPEKNPEIMTGVRVFMGMIYGGIGAIGLWFVIFFTRKKVADQFRGGADVVQRIRPVSITLIAWFMILSPLSMIMCAVMNYPMFLMGAILTGKAAAAICISWGVLYFAVGVGLLRYRTAAYWAALAIYCFGAINMMTMLIPSVSVRFMAAMNAFIPDNRGLEFAMSPWWIVPTTTISLAIPVYFLLSRKQRFFKAQQLLAPVAVNS